MLIATFSFFVLLVARIVLADLSVPEYVKWKLNDITSWHQYLPGRLLEQERLTNEKAVKTVEVLSNNIETSLRATVKFQEKELETAKNIMEGTSSQGCIEGISTYMDGAIAEGVSSYKECVEGVIPSLKRKYTNWAKTNASYHAAYQRAVNGINNCVQTYSSQDSWSRLKNCADFHTEEYFRKANDTLKSLRGSPTMEKFKNTVIGCAQDAASGVVSEGWKFLSKMAHCAKLSDNLEAYKEETLKSEFEKYATASNLSDQVLASQKMFELQEQDFEREFFHYHDLEKSKLQKYVIESRDLTYYHDQMSIHLQKYLDAVSSTSVDNQEIICCVTEANCSLTKILNFRSEDELRCDVEIIQKSKRLINHVHDTFRKINTILPYAGDYAILSCFDVGYIFAENTISNCFSILSKSFDIVNTEWKAEIVDDVNTLLGYEKSFFSNSSLPCGNLNLNKIILTAEAALYDLQRCLYIGTGTNYNLITPELFTTPDPTTSTTPVSTTPIPITTTTATPVDD